MLDHCLSLLLWTPLLGALILLCLPGRMRQPIRRLALATAVLTVLLTAWILISYWQAGGSLRFVDRVAWIPALGATYSLGADGVSVLFVALTALLNLIAVVHSLGTIRYREREYYALLLAQTTFALGVFLALDLLLFTVFWQLSVVPIYFLTGIWGREQRPQAALKLFLSLTASTGFLLLGVALLGLQHRGMFGVLGYELRQLEQLSLPLGVETLIFVTLLVAFLLRSPLQPFWLPQAQAAAPTAASLLLAGVLLKQGAYGLLRFSSPLAPHAAAYPGVSLSLAIVSFVALFYGLWRAIHETDWPAKTAYVSACVAGVGTVGVLLLRALSLGGGVLQQLSHSVLIALLLLLFGFAYERRRTALLQSYGGLSYVMPRLAAVFLAGAAMIFLLPLMNVVSSGPLGLPAAATRYPLWAGMVIPGAALATWPLVHLFRKTLRANLTDPQNLLFGDLTRRELSMAGVLLLLALWLALFPSPLLRLLHTPLPAVSR